MSFTLRPPHPSDYEVIASWVLDAAACLRWAGPRVPFPFAASELPALLAIPGGKAYCLADGNAAPLGFGQYWVHTPGTAHLGRIIVAPAARGRGLGRVLCEQLIERAVQTSDAGVVTLRVYRDNAAAVALYSSLGFVPVESESDTAVVFMRRATLGREAADVSS